MMRTVQFIAMGLLAGLAFWQLSELPFGGVQDLHFAVLSVFALAFFGSALGVLGDVGVRRALVSGLLIGLPSAALVFWKGQAFTDAEQMFGNGQVALALIAVTMIPVPFALSLWRNGRAGWCDYPTLFTGSWSLVIRYTAALLFVAVLWLVLWLLWSLLALVEIDIVGDFLTRPPVVWLVSGAALGLGLSVVTELSDMISPYLLLRLLRLLVPLVLLVELVFVAVLPASGLGHLFGYLSPATVVGATAMASILLVTIAVDQDDADAAQSRVIRLGAQGLALLLPVLAALAGWSLWLRISGHGLSPARVASVAGLVLISGYALLYVGAVLSGRGWRGHIRRANIGMSLVLMVTGALWLTPFLSAERIAAQSQVARYLDGRGTVEDLPMWEFAHDWGRAGTEALAALRRAAEQPEQSALAARLQSLDGARGRTEIARRGPPSTLARAEALRAVVSVLPEGTAVPDMLMNAIARMSDAEWLQDCLQKTPAGNAGCLLLIADFDPDQAGRDAIFMRQTGFEPILAYQERGEAWLSARPVFVGGGGVSGGALIDALIRTKGQTVPARLQALQLGSGQLLVLP